MADARDWLALVLATYLTHSTALYAAAFLMERLPLFAATRWRERLWRSAMLGALLTTTLKVSGVGPMVELVRPSVQAGASNTASPMAGAPRIGRGSALERTDLSSASRTPAPPARTTPNAQGWVSLMWWIVPVWVIGSVVALLRVSVLAWLTARAASKRVPAAGSLAEAFASIGATRGASCPRLSVHPTWTGPVTLPTGEVVVPRWVEAELPAGPQRALLAHELAHAERRDAQWIVLGLLVHTLLWLQPLTALARRRLAHLAELSADAWAAREPQEARALAESLAICAERLGVAPNWSFGSPLTSGSPLLERVERLLNGGAREPHAVPWPMPLLAVLGLFIGVLAIPGLRSDELGAEVSSGSSRSSVTTTGDGRAKVELKRRGLALRMESTASMAFATDETDVAALSPGGRFELRERWNGRTREYHVVSDSSGGLTRTFAIGRVAQPIDAAAREWRAEALRRMFRESGYDARARADRMLRSAGISRLLDEAELVHSEAAGAEMLEVAAGCDTLSAAARARVEGLMAGLGSVEARERVRRVLDANAGRR